jgi:chromosomal replication initiator protein
VVKREPMDPPRAVGGMAEGARLEGGWAVRPAGADDERAGSPEGETPLQPSFTFESFVIGSANYLAQAAALAVARTPALRCNPLFIHGDDGLGKTHLLHAIGNHVRARRPELVVCCTSLESGSSSSTWR